MDKTQIIEIVKAKPNISPLTDTEVEWFVDSAIRKCLNLRFPFKLNAEVADIDFPYFHRWITDVTIAMIENIGVANVKSYSEIGMSITYAEMTDGIPKALINDMLAMAGTLQ